MQPKSIILFFYGYILFFRRQIKLITKKFYKIDVKSDNSFGLGLFLVKKILNIHKSYLEISSTLGYGSSFSFKLSQG